MSGKQLFVAEAGDDKNNGTSEAPVRSLKRALEIVEKENVASFTVSGSSAYKMPIETALEHALATKKRRRT